MRYLGAPLVDESISIRRGDDDPNDANEDRGEGTAHPMDPDPDSGLAAKTF